MRLLRAFLSVGRICGSCKDTGRCHRWVWSRTSQRDCQNKSFHNAVPCWRALLYNGITLFGIIPGRKNALSLQFLLSWRNKPIERVERWSASIQYSCFMWLIQSNGTKFSSYQIFIYCNNLENLCLIIIKQRILLVESSDFHGDVWELIATQTLLFLYIWWRTHYSLIMFPQTSS